jgi:catechol 2,3-dioxygenase-like lactoylglutathione lyase family enzyme
MLDGKIIFPTLAAYDLERASHFYEDKLGLHRADIQTGDGIIYQTNGTRFLVYKSEAARGATTAASFLVDDLDAEMRDLRARGVEFEEYDFPGLKTDHGVAKFDGGKGAWFKDSEGNIIALTQM